MQNTPMAEIPDTERANMTVIPEYGSIDLQFAGRKLTALEKDAAQNAVKSSKHTCLQVLPNHSVNESGMLQGFVFSCDTSDQACVFANELYNLWQDSATHMTARQFVESEEVEWLRRCALRSQQRARK